MNTEIVGKLKISNFKTNSCQRGQCIYTDSVTSKGCKWWLRVYPKGSSDSSTKTEFISWYVNCDTSSRKEVIAKAFIRIGNEKRYLSPSVFKPGSLLWGFDDSIERATILQNNLEEDGSLPITFYIHIVDDWYPKDIESSNYLQKLYKNLSSENSDVTFLVEGKLYEAHKIILSILAKGLYDIAKESHTNDPIPIEAVKSHTFESILMYAYTEYTDIMPRNEEKARCLLVAADRFECLQLKLHIEYFIADNFLKAENAAEFFIFADAYSCAFLKEAASNLFVTDMEIAKGAEAWSQVKESDRLMEELLVSLSRAAKSVQDKDSKDVDQMSVNNILQELETADLELDGTREILVNRLKAHRESQQGAKKQRTE